MGRYRKGLFKRPVKGGVVGKPYLFSYGFQGISIDNPGFCGNQPALGYVPVKADVHFFAEQARYGPFTDVKISSR